MYKWTLAVQIRVVQGSTVYSELYNHYLYLIPEHLHHSPPPPQNSHIHQQLLPITCDLLCLASFTQCNVFQGSSMLQQISDLYSFLWLMILHWMVIFCFSIHQLVSIELFSLFGYYECCYEHPCTLFLCEYFEYRLKIVIAGLHVNTV